MITASTIPRAAIACGGTGGHLFPGLAVAECLRARDCEVALLVSQKEVDQVVTRTVTEMEVVTLPAVGWERGALFSFGLGFWKSYLKTRKWFATYKPDAVLAMGGFTSVPPLLAASSCGAIAFLHESNSLPGRANRWLAPWVREAFVYFPGAAPKLRAPAVRVIGMPVRPQFERQEASACRVMLGLRPADPVLLIMGGSQGAAAINDLLILTLPELVQQAPNLQYVHLTGPQDEAKVRAAYATHGRRAVVRAFLTEMEWAMSAATLSISRAGASSLAELAAMRLPAILIPYPSAADNHQYHNALAFVETGAARMVTQKVVTPTILLQLVLELLGNPAACSSLSQGLLEWHRSNAADIIANSIMTAVEECREDEPPLTTPETAGTPIRSLAIAASSTGKNINPPSRK